MAAAHPCPRVEVEWIDARSLYTNLRLSSARQVKLLVRHTIGYLVLEADDRIIVAGLYDHAEPGDEEDCVEDITVIPRGWVQKMRRLAPERKVKPKSTPEKETPA
jgi:hypothetical protein